MTAGPGPSSARPDVAVLGYPVISFVQHTHQGSADNLLGELATTASASPRATPRPAPGQTCALSS
jgi:hypothetical protein